MAQITNYQCPACTGPLHYSGATGKLQCDYCGASYEPAHIEAMYAGEEKAAEQAFQAAEQKTAARQAEAAEGGWDTSDFEQWGVDEGMKAYSCPSCGAQLICDATTAATSCPYCGNPTVVPGQFAGGLKPNCLIPFKLDQNAAKEALQKHYKGKKLLPNGFAQGNKVKEIKGVYVPFWLFDGEVDADAVFEATNSRTYTRGDYEITETDHYDVRRAGTVMFQKIPVDGSSKMPDEYMDSVEPFDYSELRAFSTAYLPGYLADKYDVTAEDCAPRADERAASTAIDAMQADVRGYQTCVMRAHNVNLRRGKVHYGLLPVYTLGTMWEGKNYLFAMNGQTGRLIGDLPVDKGKYWKWFIGITAGVTAVLGTLLTLIHP